MTAHAMESSENNRPENKREVPEESPELLRWRADALLDEMMLGGVDSSAASPTRAESPQSAPTMVASRQPGPESAGRPSLPAPSNGAHPTITANGSDQEPWDMKSSSYSAGDPDHFRPYTERPTQIEPQRPSQEHSHVETPSTLQPNGNASYDNRYPYPEADEQMLRPPSALGSRQQPAPYGNSFLGTTPTRHEEPYRPANEPGQPNGYEQSGPRSYAADSASHSTTDYGQSAGRTEQHEPFSVQKETKPWSIASGGPGDYLTSVPRHSDTPYSAPQTRYAYDPVLGPTANQQSARFADSMSVGAQAKRRTNVWPRHSRFDIHALQQEMATLQEQIDLLVRRRLDISERAQHLLDKGRTILENDPDRSAEVTYYVQQVRTMVQRTGQRVQWSNVYRTRIFTYLTAWFALSVVILVGATLYGDLIRLWLGQFRAFAFGGFLSQHMVALLGSLAAGTLGSALSALFNAWRHSQKEYGYFDRKYGLLGAVLPVIGLLAGLLIYIVFGAIYWLFEVNPVESPVAGWIPALLAFAFGASQEKIYGTTE